MRVEGLAVLILIGGCGGRTLIPLLATSGAPLTSTPAPDVPLEVITKSAAVKDPLPVRGTSVAYADFELALGLAISSAAVQWAKKNRNVRPEGWQLLIESLSADAAQDGARLLSQITIRATLRTRDGGMHIGQTELACIEGGLSTPEKGGGVISRCMMKLGRDVATWLSATDSQRDSKAEPDVPNLSGPVGPSGSVEDTAESDNQPAGED